MYLGGYELSEHAAVAYDLASLKLRCSGKGGTEKAKLNFDPSLYREYLQLMAYMDLEELLMSIRRQSAGFSRGSSAYRGVTQVRACAAVFARAGTRTHTAPLIFFLEE
mmetsp:Transcript_304/g.952  ORF Transcript_304/g.952 Transcript_304/m.952 type:complete len:108 (+) Transcript_304:325-648(+)